MKKIISILVVLFLISFTTTINAQTKPVQKKKAVNTDKTEELILLPAVINTEFNYFEFKTTKGVILKASTIPKEFSITIKTEDGEQMDVKPEFKNKKFIVTYKILKYYQEEGGTWEKDMKITKMIPVK